MAVFTVTTAADVSSEGDGVLSLREAVGRANAAAGADSVNFAAGLEGGTLVLTGGQLTVAGDLAVDGDRNDDGSRVTLDGGGNDRVLEVGGVTTEASLTDLAVTGGDARGQSEGGGGILLGAGNGLDLVRCDVSDNVAGGYLIGPSDGGGILAEAGSRLTITGSTVSGNYGTYGGAVHAQQSSYLRVEDSVLRDNTAGYNFRRGGGGAISLDGADALVSGSTITSNFGTERGGGILADRGSTLSLADSTVSANRSNSHEGYGAGGGISVRAGSEATITSSTVTGNRIPDPSLDSNRGGGIHVSEGGYGGPAGVLRLSDSIVAGNLAGDANGTDRVRDDISGTITSSNGRNVFGSDVQGAVADSDREFVDPAAVFAAIDPDTGGGQLALNGGPTPTAALRDLVSNPALSGADPSGIGTTDQRGVARPQPGTGNPDIGAFELNQAAVSTRPSANNDVITGTTAANSIDALAGNDLVRAGGGNDVVGGAGGADTIRGEAGDDRVNGSPGSDLVRGGDGNDNVRGGPGQDRLFGDPGRDLFDFDLVTDSPPGEGFRDVVGDFLRGTDRLDIASIPTGRAGQAAFRFVDTAGFTAAGQVRETTTADGRSLVQGNTDADRAPEFEVELLGRLNLAAGDFVL